MGASTKWPAQQGTNENVESSAWAIEYENHPFQPGPVATHQKTSPKQQPSSCGRLTNLELHDLRRFEKSGPHAERFH
jgi:hypothetical protein